MQKPKLLFGIHCHQPIGNFEHIFEEAYEKAYLPFVKVMESYPRVKFIVHYSGVLYDWFMEKHPEFMDLLRKLVRRGQIEILSGGYYEPILSIIPDEDKIGQIEMLNQFIKEKFGRAPQGMWLTGGIWEPSLPKILSKTGIEYALVEDRYFIEAGIGQDRLFGYYVTEEEGEVVRVFPIHTKLREFDTVFFMGEAEKFDLTSISESKFEGMEFTSFSNFQNENPPLGRVYLKAGGKFECGVDFMNYPHANIMHKKMLYVSSRLRTLGRGKSLITGSQESEELNKAKRELYKGQCSNAFLRNGLSLNYLRHAIYSHLIQSENEMEKFSRGGRSYVELTITDFDKDGQDEVILSNNLLNLYFSPKQGGSLFELDYKPKAFNLINTTRFSLLDHFLTTETTLDTFSSAKYSEAGDFVLGAYSFMPRRKEAEVGLRLAREGRVEGAPVRVAKSISLFPKQSIFTVEYEISNLGEEPDEFWFGIEFNFSMLAGNSPDRYYDIDGINPGDRSLASRGEIYQVDRIKLVDEWSGFEVSLETNKLALLWRFPIENDSGYQSSSILPNWKFKLEPNQTWSVKITLRIEE